MGDNSADGYSYRLNAGPKTTMAHRIRRYIAIISDMVGSRELASLQRGVLQRRFEELIRALNRDYRGKVVSKFVITLGDEFQGLLNTTTLLPDLIWRLEEAYLRAKPAQRATGTLESGASL
jgi:hypothetical protein